jgi:hypothetical protein
LCHSAGVMLNGVKHLGSPCHLFPCAEIPPSSEWHLRVILSPQAKNFVPHTGVSYVAK